jgi:hypothetical protein
MFDIIETQRLTLRRWRDADREPYAELNAAPRTLVFFPILTRAESEAHVDRIETRFEDRLAAGQACLAPRVRDRGRGRRPRGRVHRGGPAGAMVDDLRAQHAFPGALADAREQTCPYADGVAAARSFVLASLARTWSASG